MTSRPSLSTYLLDSEVLHVICRAVWRVVTYQSHSINKRVVRDERRLKR
jgi:hypothetical protein